MQDNSIKIYRRMLLILTIAFALTLVVNTSFAWLTSSSSSLSSINIGNINISSEFVGAGATTFTSTELLSGETIDRTFEITNLTDSTDCYIRIRGIFEMDYDDGNGYVERGDVQMEIDSTETDWLAGNNGGDFSVQYTDFNEVYYYYDTALSADSSVQVDLDFLVYPMNSEPYGIDNDDVNNDFTITVYVEVIQTGDAYQTAWSGDYPTGFPAS